ncbi:MAG TPA: hypothetical protein DHV62_06555 [Elusimicrobia bacterium]|nr:hypothetical protein [Elusimicrobiota bacterium]
MPEFVISGRQPQDKLKEIEAKDFATSAKQDTGNASLATIAGKDFATQTTLALIAGKDFSTETTLGKLLAFNAVTKIMYVDEPDANTTYQGWATAGTATSAASWMIRKIAKSGNVTSILWADGNQNYDNIWDNRTTLSYS